MSAWPKRVVAATAAGLLCGGAFGAGVGHAAPGSDASIIATSRMASGRTGGPETCPPGSRATGGGVGLTRGLTPGAVPDFVSLSNPTGSAFSDTQDGVVPVRWLSTLFAFSALDYKTFVICSQSSDATIESTSFTVNGEATGFATAQCPTGTRVVGGGAGTAAADSTIELSGPLDETGTIRNTETGDVARWWQAFVQNNTKAPAVFKVFAVCSQSSDAVVQVASFDVGNSSSDSGLATCPAGRRALGGGIDTLGSIAIAGRAFPYQVIASGPVDETSQTASTDDGDVARSWNGAIFNQSGNPQNFKVLALCASDPAGSPPSPPFPPPAPPGGGPDGLAPRFVEGLAMARARFRVGAGSTPVSAQRPRRTPAGSEFKFALSEAAAVTIVIAKRTIGRRLGGVCKRATRANRGRRRCRRFVSAGTLRRSAGPGANRVDFTGRIGRRKLRPGRYRTTAVAKDAAGNSSQPSSTTFTIVAHDQ